MTSPGRSAHSRSIAAALLLTLASVPGPTGNSAQNPPEDVPLAKSSAVKLGGGDAPTPGERISGDEERVSGDFGGVRVRDFVAYLCIVGRFVVKLEHDNVLLIPLKSSPRETRFYAVTESFSELLDDLDEHELRAFFEAMGLRFADPDRLRISGPATRRIMVCTSDSNQLAIAAALRRWGIARPTKDPVPYLGLPAGLPEQWGGRLPGDFTLTNEPILRVIERLGRILQEKGEKFKLRPRVPLGAGMP